MEKVRIVTSGFKSMCIDAGLEGNFTNHSTIELFRASVPKAIIQQRTGH